MKRIATMMTPQQQQQQQVGAGGDNKAATGDSIDDDEDANDNFIIGVDRELWLQWLKIISDWRTYESKQPEHIRDLIRKGVPNNLRAQIWKLISQAQQVTQQTSESYKLMLKQTSQCEKLIQRDIARTYPENDYFKDESGPGQEGLFNVIKAYSLHDPEVGYCQGSAFIVGLLLLQLCEEESFMLFCKIMEKYRMREIYKPTMAELGLCIYQLECLVQELLPELYVHFQTQNFYTSMYSSSWFLTLFTSNLPLHLAYRVMDLFLSEGLDMIFRLSIAILIICKEDLLKLDMEGLLKYFQKEMPSRIESDPDYLINCAYQIKLDNKKMKKLGKDYITIKNKENEEAIEFRRLRTENRLFQDRLKMLELESKELADLLIQGQVSRANEAEDNIVIKCALSEMRTSDEKHRAMIQQLEQKITEYEKLLADRQINYSAEAQMLIDSLHEQLKAVIISKAENEDEIRQLNKKIEELNAKIIEQDLFIKSLRENVPEDPIAQLEEELSAVKYREAEAQFAMRELRSELNELQSLWHKHLQEVHGINTSASSSQMNSLDQQQQSNIPSHTLSGPPTQHVSNSLNNQNAQQSQSQLQQTQQPQSHPVESSTKQQPSSLTSTLASSNPLSKFFNNTIGKRTSDSSSISGQSSGSANQVDEMKEIHRIKQEMLTLKLHEAVSLAEVKMLRSREMELETQIKIQENKFKRKEDELKKVEEELIAERAKLTEANNRLNKEKDKLNDKILEMQHEKFMITQKDVDNTILVGELKQKIASLEIKVEKVNAERKLAESGIEPKDAAEFQEKVAELQYQRFRLDAHEKKLHDIKKRINERDEDSNIVLDNNESEATATKEPVVENNAA